MNREHATLYRAERVTTLDPASSLPGRLRSWSPPSTGLFVSAAEEPRRISRSNILLTALWLFIGLVAAYDVYLSIKYQDTLRFQELNPIGIWLMEMDGGSVAAFMGAKLLGTVLALGTIQVLYWYKRAIGMTVAAALASCQALLGAFLLFG